MADTTEVDANIASQEAAIGDAIEQMKTLHHRLVTEVFTWAEARFTERAQYAATKEQPDHALALGPDGVANLKSDVSAQTGDALMQRMGTAFSKVDWPHLTHDPFATDPDNRWAENVWSMHGSALSKPLLDAMIEIYKPILEVLARHGFTPSRVHERYWQTELQPSSGLIETAREYGGCESTIRSARHKRDQLLREKAEIEAADLWGG